jgi:2-oxoglutarate dehydrogenase E2 component (dihydrolipoamide succinyltransferase)
MANFDLVMPKMGESIMEATILKWHKNEGDQISVDENILEIATDKVDTEIPSPVEGVITKIFRRENEVVQVGEVIATIQTEVAAPVANGGNGSPPMEEKTALREEEQSKVIVRSVTPKEKKKELSSSGDRFYSPLVRNIAKKEAIPLEELDQIEGSGAKGRVTKRDILAYVEERNAPGPSGVPVEKSLPEEPSAEPVSKIQIDSPKVASGEDEIVEMDRMRKLIAEHMVASKRISPHVTSFVEADMTEIVEWREKHKSLYFEKHGTKLTFTPFFVKAITRAIVDFPGINISVEGDNIIRKKKINIGIATALPSGNLIVPVLKHADHYNLVGLAQMVHDLVERARTSKLKPDEIQDGTFTLTNVGTFGNVMGTPIINQPQVAILATGAIRKKPAVVETEYGDLIAVRQKIFLSLSYDHRVVDGFLGGSFLRRVADNLENFKFDNGI